jgi:predicted DNA-binding WGR domain protein
MRRFELSDGSSNKFWEIDYVDSTDSFTVRWGRIGTKTQEPFGKCSSHLFKSWNTYRFDGASIHMEKPRFCSLARLTRLYSQSLSAIWSR